MSGYATAVDYAGFIGEAPTTDEAEILRIEALLGRASTRITVLARTGRYVVKSDGTPQSPAIVAALRDATCAQAQYWEETEDVSGAGALYDSVGMAGVTLSKRAGSGSSSGPSTRFAPEAMEILAAVGMFSTAVSH